MEGYGHMARTYLFVYSESVSQVPTPQGMKIAVVSPLLFLAPPITPSAYSFGITFGIIGLDITIKHNVKITFVNCTDHSNTFIIQDGELPPMPVVPGVKAPDRDKGIIGSLVAQNILLRNSGEYKTIIEVDGDVISEHTIDVVPQLQQDGEPCGRN